jgi:hypothetical protein
VFSGQKLVANHILEQASAIKKTKAFHDLLLITADSNQAFSEALLQLTPLLWRQRQLQTPICILFQFLDVQNHIQLLHPPLECNLIV